jgi:hypothetical protein
MISVNIKVRYMSLSVIAGLIFSATSGYAIDFFGAIILDRDVPSSYMKAGVYGFRPIVNTVAFDSIAGLNGLLRGDIILSINGKEVKKSSELNQVTTDVLSVSIFRINERKALTIIRNAVEGHKSKLSFSGIQTVPPSQTTRDVTVTIVPPPVRVVNREPEKDNLKITSAMPVVVTLPKDKSTQPDSTVKKEQEAPSLPQKPLLQAKLALVNSGAEKKLSEKDCSKVPKEFDPKSDAKKEPLVPATSSDIFTSKIKPAKDKVFFLSNKGNVAFRHSTHERSLDNAQCLICHQTENPTPDSIHKRLDSYRAVHGFCRGCHQKNEKGPVDKCHECHESKNIF